jgi:Ca2+-binding RTX toxin-like protein
MRNNNLQEASQFAQDAIREFASKAHFWQNFELSFGQDYDRVQAEKVRQSAIDGTLNLPIRVLDDASMGIAVGAFAATTNTIYLQESLVNSSDVESLAAVIIEELGHSIDSRVNQIEAPGDEGAIFSLLVRGGTISAELLSELKAEDDWGTILVDGQKLRVEMATITGTNLADILPRGSDPDTFGADFIYGLAGNDFIDGGLGNDNLYGGLDQDTLIGGLGDDNLYGEAGDDSLDGGDNDDFLIDTQGNNTLNGGLGNDNITAGVGSIFVNGGLGRDVLVLNYFGQSTFTANITFNAIGGGTLNGVANAIQGIESFIFSGSDGSDYIDASATSYSNFLTSYGGDDTLIGGSERDVFTGLDGNDFLSGGAGLDSLDGGNGNDTLIGGLGRDELNGGAGNDVLDGSGDTTEADFFAGATGDDIYSIYSAATVVLENPNEGNDTVWTNINYTLASNVENLYLIGNVNGVGNADNNVIVGYGIGNNVINGLGGNDTLVGGDGNDNLNGGIGNDYLIGGAGNDVLEGSGDIVGFDIFAGGIGDDTYGIYSANTSIVEAAGGGNDTVWTTVTYALSAGIENMYLLGSVNATGNSENNTIIGYDAGNNVINGGAGNDYLIGGAGNDVLEGSGDTVGFDTFAGGIGDDTYGIYSLNTTVIEDASAGNDTVWTTVNYNLTANVENLYLIGAVNVVGNNGNNVIVGYGAGNNAINGLDGNDTINGGEGSDTLTGGNGADTFGFQFGQSSGLVTDRITDFAIGTDKFTLFSPAGVASPAPINLVRASNDASSATVSALAQSVYGGFGTGGGTGLPVISTGGAVIIASNSAPIAGTYLIIDDGVIGFSGNDLVVNITGFSGALPTFGSVPVSIFF